MNKICNDCEYQIKRTIKINVDTYEKEFILICSFTGLEMDDDLDTCERKSK